MTPLVELEVLEGNHFPSPDLQDSGILGAAPPLRAE